MWPPLAWITARYLLLRETMGCFHTSRGIASQSSGLLEWSCLIWAVSDTPLKLTHRFSIGFMSDFAGHDRTGIPKLARWVAVKWAMCGLALSCIKTWLGFRTNSEITSGFYKLFDVLKSSQVTVTEYKLGFFLYVNCPLPTITLPPCLSCYLMQLSLNQSSRNSSMSPRLITEDDWTPLCSIPTGIGLCLGQSNTKMMLDI